MDPAHELGSRHRIPVDLCSCHVCEQYRLLLWSRDILKMCGAVDTSTHGEWR
jgi:hypothetical protein